MNFIYLLPCSIIILFIICHDCSVWIHSLWEFCEFAVKKILNVVLYCLFSREFKFAITFFYCTDLTRRTCSYFNIWKKSKNGLKNFKHYNLQTVGFATLSCIYLMIISLSLNQKLILCCLFSGLKRLGWPSKLLSTQTHLLAYYRYYIWWKNNMLPKLYSIQK